MNLILLQSALSEFGSTPLKDASKNLLAKLGYKSDRLFAHASSSPEAFLNDFVHGRTFDRIKAHFSAWQSADLLFQLTDQELNQNRTLLSDTTVDRGQLSSYVFIAIEVRGGEFPRGTFSDIARQINRLFPMPVMVIFKHGDRLTVAVINRRRNRVDDNMDVLERATLIRDINFVQPHRGHLDTLASLALPNLIHPENLPITNFDALHAAWEQIFNVELLNKRFYQELANWYFWALKRVEFPADLEPDEEKRNATGLIRLLTRLIFCWFLKEKDGLISANLFRRSDLVSLLKDFDPESKTSSTYYLAILQNLFFATLNQRMGTDGEGVPYRAFASAAELQKSRDSHSFNNLYRHEELFAIPPEGVLSLFADIPFLNGGLFECLDRNDVSTGEQRFLDGFSQDPRKRPHVPDCLFFGSGETTDLSEVYGDKKRKSERVTGLIHILSRYKFTIVENTPIDQEIALDPELLGKVFENLLASYNEETKTTARKLTGSFYTPRLIVDYMVDESLKGHLASVLAEKTRMQEPDARAKLDLLFAYTDEKPDFTPVAVSNLIAAIDAVKVLDPACGSGAFPMGVLHKLVYILTKLDPDNNRWKQTQLSKLDSVPMRDELERAFADNDDDYGRKLYLIENCLYGVDIQPIAIQITKLRFFISLVSDQRTSRRKGDNYGIRPLPNLETKFVAADSLIGMPELALVDPEVPSIEAAIESRCHSHFVTQRSELKLTLQREITDLRKVLGRLLSEGLGSSTAAQSVAAWDPFDPQGSADFFSPHWMFGRSVADGFDLVIGNPPYQSAIEHKKAKGKEYRDRIKDDYESARGTWDLYVPFFEAGIRFLKTNGILSYITPNKFLAAQYAVELRNFLHSATRIKALTDVSHLPVFDAARVYPVITVIKKGRPARRYPIALHLPVSRNSQFSSNEYCILEQDSSALKLLPDKLWSFLLSPNLIVLKEIIAGCEKLDDVSRVCATSTAAEADELGATLREAPVQGWKTINTGLIEPFSNDWGSVSLRHQGRSIDRPILPDGPLVSDNRRGLFSTPKIIIAKLSQRLEGFVDRKGEYAALNCNAISVPTKNWTLDAIAVLLHSSVVAFVYKQYFEGLRMERAYPFQAPQLRVIPLPMISVPTSRVLDALGRLRSVAAAAEVEYSVREFLWEVADACVMECYFREHMAQRDLLFLDDLARELNLFDARASESQQLDFLANFHQSLGSPGHLICDRLGRLSTASPDMLAVVKQAGRV